MSDGRGSTMPVSSIIVSTISNILINVVSTDISDSKVNLIERFRLYRFRREVKKWLEKFCLENDGSILTNGQFVKYLRYHKPVEKINDYILGRGSDLAGENEYIGSLVRDTKDILGNENINISITDEIIIKELYKKIYSQINNYYKKNLSSNQKYLYSSVLHKNSEEHKSIKDDIAEIRHLLEKTDIITDPEIIMGIYKTLNRDIMAGKLEDIYNLLPLIEGKNVDINNAVRIELSVMSEYMCAEKEIIDNFVKISHNEISNNVARVLILYWIENRTKLIQLEKYVKSEALRCIIKYLSNGELSRFYVFEKEKVNHVDLTSCKFTEQFSDEEWLVHRICAHDIFKLSFYNADEFMETLLNDNINFVEEIAIIIKLQQKLMSIIEDNRLKVVERFLEIKEQLINKKDIYNHANYKIKIMYYEALLYATLITKKDDISLVLQECPHSIKNDYKIQAFILQDEINKKIASEETVCEFCIKTDAYWLLNNYLIEYRNDPTGMQRIIENCFEAIEKDIDIFLMYVQAVRLNKGTCNALNIMDKYERLYVDYLEYWIEYAQLASSDENLVNDIYYKWAHDKLKMLRLNSEYKLVGLFIYYGKYNEAYQVLEKIDQVGNTSPTVLRMKAKVLLERNQVIEALNILQKIFDDFDTDPFVVDTYIVLAMNNHRDIPKRVIDSAKNIGTSRLLMLVSSVYAKNKEYDSSLYYITKALLKSDCNNKDILGSYFELSLKLGSEMVRNITVVEEDTAVYLRNEDGSLNIYCIYKDDVLPVEPYKWENAFHIYTDTAITIGLLRKKAEESIVIDGIQYTITEIMPVECFLHRLCMSKLVDMGVMYQFSIPTNDDGSLNTNEFMSVLKKYTPTNERSNEWIKNYTDFSNYALPFHVLQRGTNVNDAQLIMEFMKDENIIIRELLDPREALGEQYILTFATTIMLYMLGVDIAYLDKNNVVIPSSLFNELQQKCEDIIDQNNQDIVSSIGIIQEQLYVNMLSENEKIEIMKDAVGLKRFVTKFKVEKNENEIVTDLFNEMNLMDVFGVSDYDAMAIAKDNNYILVTGEVAIMSLVQVESLGIYGISIIDFLTEVNVEVENLLNYMQKMENFKFLNTLTPKTLKYIVKSYKVLEDGEKAEHCMELWIDYLSKPQDMSDEYKSAFTHVITNVFRKTYELYECIDNPIWDNFRFFVMKYNQLKIQIAEDGQFHVIRQKEIV